ncbi:MAG: fasciclin domain-containing protein [Promethearchaeota archaeon]
MLKIIDILNSDTKFYTFVQMLKLSGVIDMLHGYGPFTVLVPNNDAFGKIPSKELTNLFNDVEALEELLLYHIIPGKYNTNELIRTKSINTLQVQSIQVSYHKGFTVNNALIINSYVDLANGIIHEIDEVIKMPELMAAL